jgi:hypothetical protein
MTTERQRTVMAIGATLAIAIGGFALGGRQPAAQGRPAPAAPSDNRTRAGELFVEPPTLIALGVEWHIDGDANHNATAALAYRRSGETAWKDGLPLLRIQREPIEPPARGGGPGDDGGGGSPFRFVPPNMFAGSVFDLEPGTEYELRLRLSDPDGASGQVERIVRSKTRTEPHGDDSGRTFHVYPPDYRGPKESPAFTGLLAAYYTGSAHADWFNAFPPRVQPGDTVLVHAGVYKDNRFQYGRGQGTVFSGTYFLTQSGTPEHPILIKGAGDGAAIFDGDGAYNLFNVMAANYNYFENLTIRNTDVAFLAGTKNIAGASGFSLTRSTLENIGRGVVTDWSGSKNFYVADNVFLGRNPPNQLMGWTGRTWQNLPGFPQPLTSEYAVKVYGSGHVVAFNTVKHFHDGIDHATYGSPDGGSAVPRDRMPVSIDIYNNDIYNVDDNCVEADGAMHNVRILRNRCFNQAHRALSTQPVFGGPIYFIRNVVYHAPESGSVKFSPNPAGIVMYHNTLIGEFHSMGGFASNVHLANNLILGQGAWPEVFELDTSTNYSSSDYNGFRPNPGAENAFGWESPPFGVLADFTRPRETRRFKTLEEYARVTKQDVHSVLVDYDAFERAAMPDPKDPRRLYQPADVDLRLRAGTTAIDAGIALPNVNDGFTGRAPDLGAYESGQALPHYGPRPR